MFHPSIIELRPGKSYWRCKGTLRGYGKKLSSRRIVLVVKMVIFGSGIRCLIMVWASR